MTRMNGPTIHASLSNCDLIKRIVRVSIETNRIVANLPPLNERNADLSRQKAVW